METDKEVEVKAYHGIPPPCSREPYQPYQLYQHTSRQQLYQLFTSTFPTLTSTKTIIMKNWIIAALVGGIIIFLWQFVSWTVSGIHSGSFRYHPQQNEIMSTLSNHFTETGVYLLPTSPPDASSEDMEKLYNESLGKPMASVMYIKSNDSNMAGSMIRGFLVDVLLVLILIYILTRNGTPNMLRMTTGAIAVGLFTWLWGPYTTHNWFQMPWDAITGHLVDAIFAWGIVGLWVGWYLNRKKPEKNPV